MPLGPSMRCRAAILAALAMLAAAPAAAQQSGPPSPAADTMPGPKVGDMAPDFAVPGATRFGVLRDPVRLSSFRGNTVVLAFIVQARTRG